MEIFQSQRACTDTVSHLHSVAQGFHLPVLSCHAGRAPGGAGHLHRISVHRRVVSRGRGYGLGLCSLMFLAGAAGQGIENPKFDSFALPATFPSAAFQSSAASAPGTSQLPGLPPLASLPFADQKPFQMGPVNIRPHFLYRYSTSTGIQSRPGRSSDSAIQEVSPGVLLELGDHWMLDYTPSLRFYSSRSFQDSTDHSVMFNGGTLYRGWTFGLSQGYSRSLQPLAETASQAERESFTTAINAGYRLTSALSLQMGASQSIQFARQIGTSQELNNSRLWSSLNSLNYRLTDKWGLGLSAGGGYDDVGSGPNMAHEQVQGNINWRPSDKLHLSFNGGAEYRQFAGSGRPDAINPIFGMTVQSPFELTKTTLFSIRANRTLSSSILQNTLNVTTDFGATLSQRLFKRLNLALNGGYRIDSFESTLSSLVETREDRSISFGARLSMAFLKRANASVFYQGSDSSSSRAGFGYSNTQAGVEISYRY
ncbi:MAG: hypothetical protein K9N62_00890 [Verrucomicrobia bacterium]|nr:hypothetical protein [Verrucomicrobiota bacterium]